MAGLTAEIPQSTSLANGRLGRRGSPPHCLSAGNATRASLGVGRANGAPITPQSLGPTTPFRAGG